MFGKFSLWKYLMCRWIRSQKECRKLRRQRDVLHDMVCDVCDKGHLLIDLASEEQMSVFDEVSKDDGRT